MDGKMRTSKEQVIALAPNTAAQPDAAVYLARYHLPLLLPHRSPTPAYAVGSIARWVICRTRRDVSETSQGTAF